MASFVEIVMPASKYICRFEISRSAGGRFLKIIASTKREGFELITLAKPFIFFQYPKALPFFIPFDDADLKMA